jgi:hypothetical protein
VIIVFVAVTKMEGRGKTRSHDAKLIRSSTRRKIAREVYSPDKMREAHSLSLMEKRTTTPVSAAKKKTDMKKMTSILARGEMKASANEERAKTKKQKEMAAKKAKKASQKKLSQWQNVRRSILVKNTKKDLARRNIADEETEDKDSQAVVMHDNDLGDNNGNGTDDERHDNGNGTNDQRQEDEQHSEQEDKQHIDDSDLPINVAQQSFRAPPHFRAPFFCVGGASRRLG